MFGSSQLTAVGAEVTGNNLASKATSCDPHSDWHQVQATAGRRTETTPDAPKKRPQSKRNTVGHKQLPTRTHSGCSLDQVCGHQSSQALDFEKTCPSLSELLRD